MLCAVCNKESKNQRVCPYCFTPYVMEAPSAKRPSQSGMPAASGAAGTSGAAGATPVSDAVAALRGVAQRAVAWYRRQTRTVQVTTAGIAAVLFLWWVTGEEPAPVEAGGAPALQLATMSRDEALAIVKQTRESAIVDVQQDEVFVSYPAATFPVREEGQVALAQQFAAADAVLEGRARRIYFYNPNGKLYAQADGLRGVQVVR